MTTTGQVIYDARIDRDLTQAQVADAVGVTSSYICMIERGRAVPQCPAMLHKISSVLGIDAGNLIGHALVEGFAWQLSGDEWLSVSEYLRERFS